MNDSTISKTRPPLSDAAAIVLAGGRGLRLGRIDKAMLPIEGRPLIDRTLSKLDPIFAEIVLVARHSEPLVEFGYPIVLDRRPGSGPLGGLESGLEAISASRAFLVGCDMPHLDADLVRLLAGIEPDSPAVVPGNLDRLQPPPGRLPGGSIVSSTQARLSEAVRQRIASPRYRGMIDTGQ